LTFPAYGLYYLSLRILAINPGGGSTKVGVYDNLKPVFEENIRHSPAEVKRFPNVLDQYEMRRRAVMDGLESHGINLQHKDTLRESASPKSKVRSPKSGLIAQATSHQPLATGSFDAIVARGGTLKPLHSGIYRITRKVVDDIRAGNVQTMHASLLGPLIAFDLAQMVGKPAWFVDPESTDEFWALSRLSGLPEIPRRALSHALSVKTVAKQAARKLVKRYERCNFVVAHLGTGITIAAHLKGRQIDASNANEDGPMAPQRSGVLPAEGLVELCLKGLEAKLDDAECRMQNAECKVTQEAWRSAVSGQRKAVLDRVQRHGGLLAYLGTDDIREVEARIDKGDERAKLVYDAMIYQIAKEIGAYSCVLKGKIDAIVLTGGMTLSRRLVSELKRWIKHLAPRVMVFPGEEEMKALVRAVLRLHKGLEKERTYE
jgi:butyrate kinase